MGGIACDAIAPQTKLRTVTGRNEGKYWGGNKFRSSGRDIDLGNRRYNAVAAKFNSPTRRSKEARGADTGSIEAVGIPTILGILS